MAQQPQDKPITAEFNEGWEEGRHSADVELMQLREKVTEAAAFLDRMADRIDSGELYGLIASAAECRATAKKLRE